MLEYVVARTNRKPELNADWDEPVWAQANTLEIANFRPEGSAHRPRTRARLIYDGDGVYGIFNVQDRYVRSVATEFQASVCRDSCVEFFVRPKPDRGYFNFEMNAGGTLLVYYVADATRGENGFRDYTVLTAEDGGLVQIRSTMPVVVEPEITEPVQWTLQFAVPFALFEKYMGPLGELPGQQWRANLYKCGDATSHPHWASWSPVDEKNFHLPRCFGKLVLGS